MENLIGSNSIVFDNLEQLTVEYIANKYLIAISKFEFPKLQSFSVVEGSFVDENLLSFFNKIKHIKTLKFGFSFRNPNVIHIMENLVNLELRYSIVNEYEYVRLIELFDFLSQHQTLEQSTIIICDDVLNVDIFDEIINLVRAKPYAQFDFKIAALNHPNNKHVFGSERYQLKFEQTKHKLMFG